MGVAGFSGLACSMEKLDGSVSEVEVEEKIVDPIIEDVRCKLGDIVFSKWKGTNYLRPYVKPTNPKTEKQMEVRNAFIRLVDNWKQVNGVLHKSWNNFAKGSNMTGYNAFIGANSIKQTLTIRKGLSPPRAVMTFCSNSSTG